jgi:CBS domain containing-hemolysin-like protein
LESDNEPSSRRPLLPFLTMVGVVAALLFVNQDFSATGGDPHLLSASAAQAGQPALDPGAPGEPTRPGQGVHVPAGWRDVMPPGILAGFLVLVILSAFFSGSEAAMFSLHKVTLRRMNAERSITGPTIARMMDHPGRLLTTILVGNMIVNVLIGVLMGTRVEQLFDEVYRFNPTASYLIAILAVTAVLLFFGEITPKVLAVWQAEVFSRATILPLVAFDKVLAPVRVAVLTFTDWLFRVTRFHSVRVAPFITDEELKSVLYDGEAQGLIEEEERQMITGILEFADAVLREILVPRPDVVALPAQATVREALATFREHEYSRMPIYDEDMDHITGILVAKDLLPSLSREDLDTPVKEMARPPHFVPETMTVHQFFKYAQRLRIHMAVVVDEYGGTAGIVTLQDAIEEVVGDIEEENGGDTRTFEEIGDRQYRVDGAFNLDELSEKIGVPIEDEDHETLAGFMMARAEKILEAGDQVVHHGAVFTVEETEGKRVAGVRIELVAVPEEAAEEAREGEAP